jgi:hypothetical protein
LNFAGFAHRCSLFHTAAQRTLPGSASSRREDILAELSADIGSQIEYKEAELGRKLREDEVEVILQHWGNPIRVAERYESHRQLIGAALFPEYWRVPRIVLVDHHFHTHHPHWRDVGHRQQQPGAKPV